MANNLTLSHSRAQTYMSCSEKYRLHYEESLRPDKAFSYLFFGSKVESGLDVLLLRKKKDLTDEEKALSERCPFEVFDENFNTVEINGEELDARTTDKIIYTKKDFDENILTDEDVELIENGCNQGWVCLRRKAHLLIEAYEEEVIPQIEEVLSIQEKVDLSNEVGDSLIGYIDFIARFTDGVTYVVDNKTASRAYDDNAVEISEQFATYCEYKGIDDACYIVMEKNIRRKDPKVRITVLKGVVSESTKQVVFKNFDGVVDGIKNEEYSKNYDSCWNFGKCPYYNYCRNGSKKDLVHINKEKV